MIWNEKIECASRDDMSAIQSERLVKLVKYVYDNVEFYRKKMDNANVKPEDIKGIEDIVKLPFTTKDDLRDNYPFGLFAKPLEDIVRIHASSGTTGKATVVGYTQSDLDIWEECVARCMTMANVSKKDIIQIAYGYGLFTGGLGAHGGAQKIGATVVPMSTGNSKKLTTMMVDFGATAIACTPSYLLHIAELLEQENLVKEVKLKSAICGAEPWTEKMRNDIEERLNIKAYDIYGLSEIMGPGVACDCEHHAGLHVMEDHFYPEVLSPETLTPVKEGETGELVFTTLTKEGIPLIRYRTKDLTSLTREKCKCGRTLTRISRLKGRVDDMLIIRGVNVFPSQIETVLLNEGYQPNYQIVVDRVNNNDTFDVNVELTPEQFTDKVGEVLAMEKSLANAMKTMLGINPAVHLVAPKTIARSEGKAVRVIDKRKLI